MLVVQVQLRRLRPQGPEPVGLVQPEEVPEEPVEGQQPVRARARVQVQAGEQQERQGQGPRRPARLQPQVQGHLREEEEEAARQEARQALQEVVQEGCRCTRRIHRHPCPRCRLGPRSAANRYGMV